MKLAVVGAGGVGGYFGAQLAAAGHDVRFIARGRQLEALRRVGLTIASDHRPVQLPSVTATEDFGAAEGVDLVLVAVKLGDTEQVAARLGQLPGPRPAVLSLQNGVQKDDVLRAALPDAEVLGGVCYISAAIESPGVIRHHGSLAKIVFGAYGGAGGATASAFHRALLDAGVEVELSGEIETVLWRKFAFLVALSSVTSASRSPIGILRELQPTRRLLADVMSEAVAVARARGVALPNGYVDGQLEFIDSVPPEMTSSMFEDLSHGRPLELPWLGGGVVAMGAELGVPTPYNSALAAVLEPYVDGAAS